MIRYDPDKHHRRSIRLKGYDYAQAGAYFVTIVTRERECWFKWPRFHAIVEREWYNLPNRFPTVRLDEFVIMPNHVHFVIWLNPPMESHAIGMQPVGAQFNCAQSGTQSDWAPADADANPIGRPFTVDRERPTLGQLVRAFKAVITRRIRQAGGEGFAWQRNYYERIIRNERELHAIRRYIRDNPTRWAEDLENPGRAL